MTWQGIEDVRVEDVPDPIIKDPTDAIVEITSTAICGSDLHLYRRSRRSWRRATSSATNPWAASWPSATTCTDRGRGPRGDPVQHLVRVVLHVRPHAVRPVRDDPGPRARQGRVAVRLHQAVRPRARGPGRAAAGAPGPLRADQGARGPPDERFLFLSDVLPTAWQAVAHADVPADGALAVIGLGPIGQMACRIARQQGIEHVYGVDLVPERLAMAERHGAEVVDMDGTDDVGEALRALTGGRGPDGVIDAVGMEAHGAPVAGAMQRAAGLLPKAISEPLAKKAGIDRLTALRTAIDAVRRGGTLSIVGVYGGAVDPLPMLDLFDKGVQIRMGQAHVKRWVPEILPLLERDEDVLGLDDFVTHTMPLARRPPPTPCSRRSRTGRSRSCCSPDLHPPEPRMPAPARISVVVASSTGGTRWVPPGRHEWFGGRVV